MVKILVLQGEGSPRNISFDKLGLLDQPGGGGHSESLRPSDMGSVQNLIGMPSNGYVPKVAV